MPRPPVRDLDDSSPSVVATFDKTSGRVLQIGIVGNGFVGCATQLLGCANVSVLVYDVDAHRCVPRDTTMSDLAKKCDIVFVCVPTPMDTDGSCYTRIVRNVVHELVEQTDPRKTTVVVRSTVPPGTCRELGVAFMPEFLTEKNWRRDFKQTPQWIVGADDPGASYGHEAVVMKRTFIGNMQRLLTFAMQAGNIDSDRMVVVGTKEAEMCKYTRNCFLATKIAYFNEIHHLCQLTNVDFEVVRGLSAIDSRIGESHTQAPGPDGKLGFGGTCLPKDINAMVRYMLSVNKRITKTDNPDSHAYNHYPCKILGAVNDRNQTIDRPLMDWSHDKGRSTV